MKKDGLIELADGSILKLKIFIIDVKEVGSSPFGGVYFLVRSIGGVSVEYIPEDLRKIVRDRPPAPLSIPQDGWEIIDIKRHESAIEELEINTSKGRFKVRVEAEPLMVARNTLYKAAEGLDEPLYIVNHVNKISWRPMK